MKRKIFVSMPLASRRDDESWNKTNILLARTLRSLFNQTHEDFRILLCCHDTPECYEAKDSRIDFIVPSFPRPANSDEYLADKGRKRKLTYRRVADNGGGYVVMQDADDLLSKNIFSYFVEADDPHGYVYRMGYAMDYQSGALAPVPGIWNKPFSHVCGSSAAIFFTPDDIKAKEDVYALKFRKHADWETVAAQNGRPLHRVPFPASVYVLNSDNNVSSILSRSAERMDTLVSTINFNRLTNAPWLYEQFALDKSK